MSNCAICRYHTDDGLCSISDAYNVSRDGACAYLYERETPPLSYFHCSQCKNWTGSPGAARAQCSSDHL
jgi:hypothetical protein